MTALSAFLPEVYIFATALGLIVGEAAHADEKMRLVLPTSLLGLLGAFIQTLLSYRGIPVQAFAGTALVDGFSIFFKILFIMLAAAGVSFACVGDDVPRRLRSEFCALVLLGTLALMIASSTTNLFVATLAIQLAGVVGHFLLGFRDEKIHSSEASVKWLLSSALAGVFMFIGILGLFFLAGTANIHELRALLSTAQPNPATMLFVFSMIFLGLSASLMVFPFQFWVPDVIQGGSFPGGAHLVLGLRAGAFAVATRIWMGVFAIGGAKQQLITEWLAIGAALTLLFPAFLSLRQTSAKRLLGCLAITQSGFLVLGLVVLEGLGVSALLFNLVIDLFAFSGVVFALSLAVERRSSDEFSGLKGVFSTRPWEAVALILFLITWLGLPPFAGSVGKLGLLSAALKQGWFFLAFVGLAAFAMNTWVAGRLILTMVSFVEEKSKDSEVMDSAQGKRALLIALLVPIVFSTVFAESLLRWTAQSVRLIFW